MPSSYLNPIRITRRPDLKHSNLTYRITKKKLTDFKTLRGKHKTQLKIPNIRFRAIKSISERLIVLENDSRGFFPGRRISPDFLDFYREIEVVAYPVDAVLV